MINSAYIPLPHTDIVLQDVDGESLILDNSKELIHQLNETATFIWQHCDGKNSLADIASLIAQHYSVSEDSALKDVLAAVENFKGLKLLDE